MLKIILGLPVLLFKTVLRTLSLAIITFPITGWFIIPGITNGETSKMLITIVALTVITVIREIVIWVRDYDTLCNKSIVFW